MSVDDRLPPLQSSRSSVTISGFFARVAAGMALHIKTEPSLVPSGAVPTFAHSFPKERLEKPDHSFDVITYRVLKATMAPTDNAGARTPRAPVLRESKIHPELGKYKLQIYGWWELYTIEFSIWSRSNARADDLTIWFHLFMMKYAFAHSFFKACGVDWFRFVERADDDIDLNTGQELYRRKLAYEVRLEMLDAFEKKSLESIDITIGNNRSTDLITLTD